MNKENINTLIDEVRVKLHLGGMEAKDTFKEIEKRAEKVVQSYETATRETIDELVRDIKKLKTKLGFSA